jgi:hypothetical protein
MGCEIVEEKEGQFTFRISGKLKRAELARTQAAAAESMRSGMTVRFLVLTQDFQGWEGTDGWEDLSFQTRFDWQIEKIAIVGEKRWQELAEVFAGKGLRPVEIRYFTPSEAPTARVWVKQTGRKREVLK